MRWQNEKYEAFSENISAFIMPDRRHDTDSFFLIYSLLPTFYRQYKHKEIESRTRQLAAQLHSVSSKQIADQISDYALSKGYGYTAAHENGKLICQYGTEIGFTMIGETADAEASVEIEIDCAESEETFQTADGKRGYLTLTVSLQPIEDAVSVLFLILPAALTICLAVSAVAAFFYSKAITKPICNIASATVRMRSLLPDVSCSADRNDEIGILARNINEMYQTLLSTISNLEREIEITGKAEQEKLDFLLLASHELKTPVTAVRGMIYPVGVYRDRDALSKIIGRSDAVDMQYSENLKNGYRFGCKRESVDRYRPTDKGNCRTVFCDRTEQKCKSGLFCFFTESVILISSIGLDTIKKIY